MLPSRTRAAITCAALAFALAACAGDSGRRAANGDSDLDAEAHLDSAGVDSAAETDGSETEPADVDPSDAAAADTSGPSGDTPREACSDRNPERNLYFGDLHVHTALSMDAYANATRVTPEQAYGFARGEEVRLYPFDQEGVGTRSAVIDRPLDFVALTDHSEFLAETRICTDPELPGYDSGVCGSFRGGGRFATGAIGVATSSPDPTRDAQVCGEDGSQCADVVIDVWREVRGAAEAAYDRTSACTLTTFVGYEWTGQPGISVTHRNVIFRGSEVPDRPISYIDAPTRWELWERLQRECADTDTGCQALAIPHNANQSNGHAFMAEYPGAESIDDERAMAATRAAMEPVAEVIQHKGESMCMNGLGGLLGEPDELCDFEKLVRPPPVDCGDQPGSGGLLGAGCFSWRDFGRGATALGLAEWRRLGVNPFRLGFIGSTDTHNGTPGQVAEDSWVGHDGMTDAAPEARIDPNEGLGGGILYNPGGLAAVWAIENSRPAIFDAIRRREVYATSGPRISVRFFGAWDLPDDMCGAPDLVSIGYDQGVPMGGLLDGDGDGQTPTFVVSALQDAGAEGRPGAPLQRVQIVKVWLDGDERHTQVFEVAGEPDNGASVDTSTCERSGDGFGSLCAVWRDPDFDPDEPAAYYARVVENPSCRWNAHLCRRLAPADRPATCDDPDLPRVIQERAWTSPIWYEPTR